MKFAASLTLLATQRFLQAWAAPAPNPQEADATNEGPRATNEPIRDPIDPPPGLVMEPQLPPQVYANFSYSDEQFWFGDLDPAKAIEEILKCPDLACEPGMAIPFDPAFHTTTEDGKRHRVVMKVDGSFNNLGLPGNKLQLVQLAKAAFEVLYETKAVENAPEESFIVNACAPWAVSGCPGMLSCPCTDSTVSNTRHRERSRDRETVPRREASNYPCEYGQCWQQRGRCEYLFRTGGT